MHYKMKPEALANNVVFTIGKLTHKHAENGKLLAKHSVQLVLQSLQSYGIDKVTQAGNGLFALGALIQHNNTALEKIVTVEVIELLVKLLCAHSTEDASVAVYGINILEAIFSYATAKGDAVFSFLFKALVGLKMGTLAMHILDVYSFNELNCNSEIVVRVVNLVHMMFIKTDKHDSSDSSPDSVLAQLKAQLNEAHTEELLQGAVLNSVSVMEKVTNDQAQEIINKLRRGTR